MSPRAVVRGRRAAYFGMLLATSGTMVIFPLFPSLQGSLDLATAGVGFIAAGGFAATLLAELLFAPQADRGHGRLMATVGILLVGASLGLFALSTEVWQLVAGRAVGGIGMGLFMAAASALLVRSDASRSGELLGKLSAFELAGISIGPMASALGLYIADPAAIFATSAIVVAGGAIFVAMYMREPAAHPDAPLPPMVAFDLLRSRFVLGAVALQFAVMVPTGAYDAIWPRFMADIGAEPILTAASFTVFAVPYVLLAAWAGRLADRVGGAQAYARGVVVLIITITLYGVLANPYIATGLGFVESSGQALAFIGAAAAMAHIVEPARAASAQGLLRAFGLTAATIASAFSGVVYAEFSALALFWGTAATVAVISVLGLVLLRGAKSARTGASKGSDRDEMSPATVDAGVSADASAAANLEVPVTGGGPRPRTRVPSRALFRAPSRARSKPALLPESPVGR